MAAAPVGTAAIGVFVEIDAECLSASPR
jgi:hypothetical protein